MLPKEGKPVLFLSESPSEFYHSLSAFHGKTKVPFAKLDVFELHSQKTPSCSTSMVSPFDIMLPKFSAVFLIFSYCIEWLSCQFSYSEMSIKSFKKVSPVN
jgi:hypothetical protein